MKEPLNVLAAPSKGAIGEPVGVGPVILSKKVSCNGLRYQIFWSRRLTLRSHLVGQCQMGQALGRFQRERRMGEEREHFRRQWVSCLERLEREEREHRLELEHLVPGHLEQFLDSLCRQEESQREVNRQEVLQEDQLVERREWSQTEEGCQHLQLGHHWESR